MTRPYPKQLHIAIMVVVMTSGGRTVHLTRHFVKMEQLSSSLRQAASQNRWMLGTVTSLDLRNPSTWTYSEVPMELNTQVPNSIDITLLFCIFTIVYLHCADGVSSRKSTFLNGLDLVLHYHAEMCRITKSCKKWCIQELFTHLIETSYQMYIMKCM